MSVGKGHNSGEGGGLRRTVSTREAEMAAFDALPSDLRAALREAPMPAAAVDVARITERWGPAAAGRLLDDFVRRCREAHRRLVEEACSR